MLLLLPFTLLLLLLPFLLLLRMRSSSSSSLDCQSTDRPEPKYDPDRPEPKYDVFLSFRGEDTRDGFVSHLYSALTRNKIQTFRDNDLRRGDTIEPSLLRAIEQSKISVIIFSENYASSKWCLDELQKVLQCREMFAQLVVPVFYQVDPSHVRNQLGSFAKAFAKHERCFKRKIVQGWRAALMEAANLSGWDSLVTRPESALIEKLVEDILKKLNRMSPRQSMGLVGIDSRVEQVQSLLDMESLDVRIIGIWGMGGIGKTALAGAVFDKISSQFECCYFFANVKEQLQRCTPIRLQDEFLSRPLGEKSISSSNLEFIFVQGQLRHKKVAIVLDNVDNAIQLQDFFVQWRGIFGPGSRILLTSRDIQVLKNVEADAIYEVKGLNKQEALQLFCLNAFKKNCPTGYHKELSERVVNYTAGNPLALRVLGSMLFGRSIEEWHSALGRLKAAPHCEIQNVLRISYDGLDLEEQEIFLDIGLFFKGEDRNHVTRILNACYSSCVHFVVSRLIDMSLITISDNKLEMHDLLQEMGRGIVREESVAEPEKRSRLWDSDDVRDVLEHKKGTEAIKGMSLDISTIKKMHLEADAFRRMSRLRLLKFYASNISIFCENGIHIPPCGLQFISEWLRYLHWHGFPSKSLPSNFCAENLVELILPNSKLEQLWTGAQHLLKLKLIDISGSKYLKRIPDLSKAKNVQTINLCGCSNLVELHSSTQHLSNLECLNLAGCKSLRRFPNKFDSKFLRELSLSYCYNVKKCPEVLGNLEKLRLQETGIEELPPSIQKSEALIVLDLCGCSKFSKFPENTAGTIAHLDLSGTLIKEVPSSIKFLTRLVELSMENCKELSSVSGNICKLKSLKYLDLSGCSKMETFPEILEPMDGLKHLYLHSCTSLRSLPYSICNMISLEELDLSGTAIQELPYSFGHLNRMKTLIVENLDSLPCSFHNWRKLKRVEASNRRGLKSFSLEGLCSLETLNLRNCSLSEIPSGSYFESLYFLQELNLCGNKFQSLPAEIKFLPALVSLDVSYCNSLRSLPDLPSSLKHLNASYCNSLETLPSTCIILGWKKTMKFTNCYKLDEETRSKIMTDIQSLGKNIILEAVFWSTYFLNVIVLPGSKIPEQCSYTGVGSSVQFCWDQHNFDYQVVIAFFIVVASEGNARDCWIDSFEMKLKNGVNAFKLGGNENCRGYPSAPLGDICLGKSDNTFMWLAPTMLQELYYGVCVTSNEGILEFYPQWRGELVKQCKVKKVGVVLDEKTARSKPLTLQPCSSIAAYSQVRCFP